MHYHACARAPALSTVPPATDAHVVTVRGDGAGLSPEGKNSLRALHAFWDEAIELKRAFTKASLAARNRFCQEIMQVAAIKPVEHTPDMAVGEQRQR